MSVIAANTDVPVSVKCRIGLDDHDSYNELCKDPLYAFYVSLREEKIRLLCNLKPCPFKAEGINVLCCSSSWFITWPIGTCF